MNKRNARFGLVLALLLGAPVQASLVKVFPESAVPETEDGASSLGYDVNSATGDYALCYGNMIDVTSTLRCRQYDAQDTPITPWLVRDMNSRPIDAIDVALTDDGRLYVALVADRFGSVAGWSRDGVTLFTPVQLSNSVFWADLDVAPTANGFWVAGTAQPIDRHSMQFRYFAYDLAGTLLHQATKPDGGFSAATTCGPDLASDIAATRSGDVALTWVQAGTLGACLGSVVVQTFRSNFTATSEPRVISTIVRDDGADASPYYGPQVAAIDDGRFVLTWVGEAEVETATIGASGTVLVTAADVMTGVFPQFSVNPGNGDFAITSDASFCDLKTRLAIEGDLDPEATFGVGTCLDVNQYRTAFERDGRLTVARARNAGLSLSRVALPAQIEIANVVLSEGDPDPGGAPPSPVNAITVSLDRPHPNGEDVQVSYFSRSGTALMNQDFAQVHDTAVIAASDPHHAATIPVTLLPDTHYEDDEAFTIELEQLAQPNAVLRNGAQRSTVVIRDDDATPPITPDCDAGDPLECRTTNEPDLGQSVDVLLTLSMAQPLGVNLQIGYATQDGSATAGSDYAARSGLVQIVAGATSAVIPLRIFGDELPEDTETFHVRLSAPAGVTLAATDLVVHILDDAICFLAVAPDEIVTTEEGSTETLAVTTRDGCDWSVASPDGWIAITSPASNTGSGAITLDIAPFDAAPGEFERSGSVVVTLADPLRTITVPVDQDGDCSFAVAPGSQQFAVDGGSGTFAVDASVPECAWAVTSPAPWITILSPLEPVSGDGTVSYRIDVNADQVNVEPGPRSIALASEEFGYQIAQDGCSYSLDSNTLAADAAGDTSYFVDINAQAVCRWTAVSHASWILVQDGASGTGEGSVELFVTDNPTVQPRTGTVSIGDETLVVTQGGLACDYALTPDAIVACPDGRAFAFDIAATDGCAWTLQSDASWAALVNGDAGVGDDDAQGLVDVNLSEAPRTATLQLRAQNVGIATANVLQEGYLTYEIFAAVRPADWRYQPDSAWSVGGGDLIGTAGPGAVLALDQASTCSECEISARLALDTASSAPGENLALLGWYRDARNHVALGMDEFSNRWTLSQVVDGQHFSVEAEVEQIVPNAFYDLHVVFDGVSFVVELGGQALLDMPVHGDPPNGSAGLRLTAGSGRLSEIRVNRIEANPDAAAPMRVFASGFEPFETAPPPTTPNTSQCRLSD